MAETRDVQARLNRLNFGAGDEDGLAGKDTARAIKAFQASIGARETGKLTETEKLLLVNASEAGASQIALDETLAPLDQNTSGSATPQQIAEGTTSPPGTSLPPASLLPAPGLLPAPTN